MRQDECILQIKGNYIELESLWRILGNRPGFKCSLIRVPNHIEQAKPNN